MSGIISIGPGAIVGAGITGTVDVATNSEAPAYWLPRRGDNAAASAAVRQADEPAIQTRGSPRIGVTVP